MELTSQGLAREGDIDPVVGRDQEIKRHRNFKSPDKNNRFLSENQVLVKQPLLKVWLKNRRWRCAPKIIGQRSHSFGCGFLFKDWNFVDNLKNGCKID